jgi:integrase
LRVKKPQLRVKEYPHSLTARYVIEGLRVNGKRRRLFFRTKAEADLELARIKKKRLREGEDALSIPDSLRIMARDCDALLAPFSKTILEATTFYLNHLQDINRSISLEALVSEYQDSRRRAGLSKVHLTDLRYRLGRFSRDLGSHPVRTLTTAQIEDWLHTLALGPKSFNNFRDRLAALFTYGQARHYVATNPVLAIQPIKQIDGPPEIFTPDDLAAVLGSADDSLLPMLVIGAFAGLRTAELLRLEWCEVDLVRGFIEVSAAKAKTARRRLIPIADNLAEWLRPYAGRTGKVYRATAAVYHKACGRTTRAAGLPRWPKNGLRHSYASYHLAKHENAPALSLHMGHVTPHMLFENYRELVTPEAAAHYWAIRPTALLPNIVPIQRTSTQ